MMKIHKNIIKHSRLGEDLCFLIWYFLDLLKIRQLIGLEPRAHGGSWGGFYNMSMSSEKNTSSLHLDLHKILGTSKESKQKQHILSQMDPNGDLIVMNPMVKSVKLKHLKRQIQALH